jgi:hypothetical protein
MSTVPQANTVSEGRIARMDIPSDWSEEAPVPEDGARYTREFYSREMPDAKIYLHYRGHPLTNSAATLFRQLLEGPLHDLTSIERTSLSEVIGNAGIPELCRLEALKSTKINMRSVLLLEGIWSGGNRSLQLFISADPECTIVQEVWFMAPDRDFSSWKPTFEWILESIEWTD